MRIERAKLRDETTSQAEVSTFFTTAVCIHPHLADPLADLPSKQAHLWRKRRSICPRG